MIELMQMFWTGLEDPNNRYTLGVGIVIGVIVFYLMVGIFGYRGDDDSW